MIQSRLRIGLLLTLCVGVLAGEPCARADEASGFDTLLGTQGTPFPATTGHRADDAARVRAWIRDRMQQEAFYKYVLPRLFAIFSKLPWNSYFRPPLQTAEVDGRTVYFEPKPGRDPKRPCAPKELVEVVPWWDGTTKLWVCSEDYRPQITKGNFFPNTPSYCEVDARPESECGCGQHLIYCAPEAISNGMMRAAFREVRLTAIDVIQRHLPFSTLMTRSETVHAGLLDALYKRFMEGEKMAPMMWTAAERDREALRPRPAPFTGGILSTPIGMNYDISRRVTGRLAWTDFLCMPLVAARTHTEDIFLLPDANLRFRGQERLTQMTGCKECHRRLEGIVRAFADFSLPMVGHRWVPVNEPGLQTQFYGRDSRDLRAEGPATPGFIGETLTHQPEFTGCVTSKVEELFFGGSSVSPAQHEQLRARFADKQDFARLVEDAAVARSLGFEALLDTPENASR